MHPNWYLLLYTTLFVYQHRVAIMYHIIGQLDAVLLLLAVIQAFSALCMRNLCDTSMVDGYRLHSTYFLQQYIPSFLDIFLVTQLLLCMGKKSMSTSPIMAFPLSYLLPRPHLRLLPLHHLHSLLLLPLQQEDKGESQPIMVPSQGKYPNSTYSCTLSGASLAIVWWWELWGWLCSGQPVVSVGIALHNTNPVLTSFGRGSCTRGDDKQRDKNTYSRTAKTLLKTQQSKNSPRKTFFLISSDRVCPQFVVYETE